jgi:SAM-dependent methyltransferase
MSNSIEIQLTAPGSVSPALPEIYILFQGGCHYPASDKSVFTAGYNTLCGDGLNGKRVLEVCCGRGELALQLARAFPEMQLVANDRYDSSAEVLRMAQQHGEATNAMFFKGDALNLPELESGSFDVIFGQAALHHLAHNLDAVREEYSRLLKPGGRLVFIFEPFGHNLFVACVRAIRIARAEMGDESNLHLAGFEEVARGFSRCEVQSFNLLGYVMKAAGEGAGARLVNQIDTYLFQTFPPLKKYGANCNVVFVK